MKKKDITKFVLDNAINYGGKADMKSVMSHLLANFPDLKKTIKGLIPKITKEVEHVNSLSLSEQKDRLEKLGGIKKKKREEAGLFDFMNIKKGDKVITAFPPGPEKYPHIGHAKSLILNYLLAKEYNGKFVLRFEDTNPGLVKKEFYKIMIDDFKWLGVKWDKLQYASDYMALYYKLGEKLIKNGSAYVCFCSKDDTHINRRKGAPCKCRNDDHQLEKWGSFFKSKEGSCVVRLKIDMSHKNTTMRDPAIFRIIDEYHPRTKKKFRVWPAYDFQSAIMDGYHGITHRIRSKEFELRSELQKHIQKILGLKETLTYEIARFNLEGVLSSGREIREKIKNKELLGWDDPRLTTIAALRRRGFVPEAIKDFAISTGISKAESKLKWDDLIVKNKKILEEKSNRYFFIWNPKRVRILGAPDIASKIPIHPDFPKRGGRILKSSDIFYVADKLKKNVVYRFMHLFNFKNEKFHSIPFNKKLNAVLIHWLPFSKEPLKVEVLMDDASIIKGFGEYALNKLLIGDVVQFVRFGFARLDVKEKDKLKFVFSHR